MSVIVLDAADMLWALLPTLLNLWIYIIAIKAVGAARHKFGM
jgi:hypothetical protein